MEGAPRCDQARHGRNHRSQNQEEKEPRAPMFGRQHLFPAREKKCQIEGPRVQIGVLSQPLRGGSQDGLRLRRPRVKRCAQL